MSNACGRLHSRRLVVEIWFQSLFAFRVFVELHAGSIRTTLQKGGGNRTRKPFYVTPLLANNLRKAKKLWQRAGSGSNVSQPVLPQSTLKKPKNYIYCTPLGCSWMLLHDVRFCK
jgi:hypothetical protein